MASERPGDTLFSDESCDLVGPTQGNLRVPKIQVSQKLWVPGSRVMPGKGSGLGSRENNPTTARSQPSSG